LCVFASKTSSELSELIKAKSSAPKSASNPEGASWLNSVENMRKLWSKMCRLSANLFQEKYTQQIKDLFSSGLLWQCWYQKNKNFKIYFLKNLISFRRVYWKFMWVCRVFATSKASRNHYRNRLGRPGVLSFVAKIHQVSFVYICFF
jgi:hypothetical protein